MAPIHNVQDFGVTIPAALLAQQQTQRAFNVGIGLGPLIHSLRRVRKM
jgi:hypothetical protein